MDSNKGNLLKKLKSYLKFSFSCFLDQSSRLQLLREMKNKVFCEFFFNFHQNFPIIEKLSLKIENFPDNFQIEQSFSIFQNVYKICIKSLKDIIFLEKNQFGNLISLTIELRYKLIGEIGSSIIASSLRNFIKLQQLELFLNCNNLGNNGVEELCKSVSNLTLLDSLKLDLTSNKISKNGSNFISELFSSLICLNHLTLNLDGNQIYRNEVNHILKGMLLLKKLKVLSLDFLICDNTLNNPNEFLLLNKFNNLTGLTIKSINKKISESEKLFLSEINLCNLTSLTLNFYRCGLSKNCILHLSSFLNKQGSLISLDISLCKNKLNDDSLYPFLISLGNLTCLKFLYLNLSSNIIENTGVESLSNSISKLFFLEGMMVNLNSNRFGQQGVYFLLNSISYLSNLRYINFMLDQEKVSKLSNTNTVFHPIILTPTILNLDLSRVFIGTDTIILSQFISQLTHLKKLNLNLEDNEFTSDHVIPLFKSLENLSNLTSLYIFLDTNSIQDDSLLYLASSFIKMSKLKYLTLFFSYNAITEDGARVICESILNNLSVLKCLKLNLSYNQIKDSSLFNGFIDKFKKRIGNSANISI